MATVREDSIPHVVRTAADQRQQDMFNATIGRIEQVNSTIRLIRLYLNNDQLKLRHLPGQYIDLHVPSIDRVGGFTITSPPQTALKLAAPTPSTTTPASAASFDDPYIELAIQDSPSNPPAAFLWRPAPQIINAPVSFRIGGNFTFPPMTLTRPQFEAIHNIVCVAGGVGINPIMSMLSAMMIQGPGKLGGLPKRLRLLYTSRRIMDGEGKLEEVLFEKRLDDLVTRCNEKHGSTIDLKYIFFETSKQETVKVDLEEGSGNHNGGANDSSSGQVVRRKRRIRCEDVIEAIGPESEELRKSTLVYICGLPAMTDEYVDLLKKQPGLDEQRVLCEKWW